jgi:hypothetical protein
VATLVWSCADCLGVSLIDRTRPSVTDPAPAHIIRFG